MADPRSSSLSQVPGSPTEEGPERSQRLTEQERKANHISSEQKRRLHIREGFERIAQLVPGMAGQERSEGVVLCGTVDYLKKLLQERRAMIGALEANGMNVEPHLKKALDDLPPGWLDGVPIPEPPSSPPAEPPGGEPAEESGGSHRETSEPEGRTA